MNKVYKTVWNEHTGQVVVVSELTKSRGKRTASSVASQGAHPFRILSSKVATLALASAGMLSLAMPGAVFAQDGIKFEADTGTTSIVELGDTLGIKGGENIETSVDSNDDNTVTIGLKEEIDLGGSGSLTIGSTVVDSAGLSFGISGPSITNSGIDAGGAPITNVADGTSADHAATVGQVDAVQSTADSAMQSFVTKADGYAGETVDKGNPEANFLSGNNIALQADANGITVATKDEVTFDKVTIDGGGPVLDSDGINAGGKKITNVADGTTDGDAVNYGQLFGNKAEGIKYFRAKSDKDDAEAAGEDSVAIGPEAKAEGDQSLAAGVGAVADGPSTIAIGEGAEVEKDTDDEDSEGAIAIGKDSHSKGAGSLAAGRDASASGSGALALGDDSTAAGTSVAVGAGSISTGDGTAIGPEAEARAPGNVSVGYQAGLDTHNETANDYQQNTAIGSLSGRDVKGQVNTALGFNAGNHIRGNHNVSIGNRAGNSLAGDSNISIGLNANKDTTSSIYRSIALGQDSTAETDAIAMGHEANAEKDSIALGAGSSSVTGSVTLGYGAAATAGDSVALGKGSIASESDVVSVGNTE